MLCPGGNPPGRRLFQGEQLKLPPPCAIAIVFGENGAPSARAPGCGAAGRGTKGACRKETLQNLPKVPSQQKKCF